MRPTMPIFLNWSMKCPVVSESNRQQFNETRADSEKRYRSGLVLVAAIVLSGLEFGRLGHAHDGLATGFAFVINMFAYGVFIVGKPFPIGWLIHATALCGIGQWVPEVSVDVFVGQSNMPDTGVVGHQE